MSENVSGISSAVEIKESGRGVIGIASPEDLAVNFNADLAIGDGEDLSVFSGVNWMGTTAVELIFAQGGGARMNAQPQ